MEGGGRVDAPGKAPFGVKAARHTGPSPGLRSAAAPSASRARVRQTEPRSDHSSRPWRAAGRLVRRTTVFVLRNGMIRLALASLVLAVACRPEAPVSFHVTCR